MRKCALLVSAFLIVTVWFEGVCMAQRRFTVEPAPEWDSLFDRDSGWTGADGIYSIPLNQDESAGAYAFTDTLFVFSDTFIGEVTADGERAAGTTIVNNTIGFLPGGTPAPWPIDFFFARDSSGAPKTMFVPEVPGAEPDEWYWLKDGIALDGAVYLFASRFRSDPVDLWFREGLTMIEIPPGSRPPFNNHVQREVPLALPPSGDTGAIVYGGSIMPNTAAAGAPFPDGFIYIYGTREDTNPPDKKVVVARVREEDFPDVGKWHFYDGTHWVSQIERAAVIANRASMELSVSPLPNGKYVMVFQIDQVSRRIGLRVGGTPWGPFGRIREVYECPEPALLPGVFVYNAKAHPHLSEPGELLISYNVNTINFWDHFAYADIYRPRFIKIIRR